MHRCLISALIGVSAAIAQSPKSGPVEIMKLSDVKAGMQATAWTVFQGTAPEAVPVEIIGVWKNAWGPKQDIILGKMGGKVQRTNVAGGMSGSPVYVDGKLIGAVALRMSVFSPDAICGITPIELMTEINDMDKTRPADARTPDANAAKRAMAELPNEYRQFASQGGYLTPIDMPLVLSGFTSDAVREFSASFREMGITAVAGGAASTTLASKPAAGWEKALAPGQPIAGVLVSGDMSVTGLGTVTYNDGKRVLGFGHPFFNLGPVNMPMAAGEIVTILASAFQPNKVGNATDIVGALTQDRHSGIGGVLGKEAEMIPVTVEVQSPHAKKSLRFNVFVQQKWTPFLMMLTLFNSISGMNDFTDEATYKLSGTVEMDGEPNISLATMTASSETPMPAPMALAGWWGDKFNRLFLNAVETPKLKSVNVKIDLIPERRIAGIENAWVASNEVRPGEEVAVKVFLRPYRGERIEREVKVRIPQTISKGSHRILLTDAETLNRMQNLAALSNRYLDLTKTVSLINQERSNHKLYVSLAEASPTAYLDDKTLPSLPPSVLNVMQAGRASTRAVLTSPESIVEQAAVPFDYLVNGSYSLRVTVK